MQLQVLELGVGDQFATMTCVDKQTILNLPVVWCVFVAQAPSAQVLPVKKLDGRTPDRWARAIHLGSANSLPMPCVSGGVGDGSFQLLPHQLALEQHVARVTCFALGRNELEFVALYLKFLERSRMI